MGTFFVRPELNNTDGVSVTGLPYIGLPVSLLVCRPAGIREVASGGWHNRRQIHLMGLKYTVVSYNNC